MQAHNSQEERILVLAPKGRDAQVIEQVLQRDAVHCHACAGYQDLLDQLGLPAGAALIVEEALNGVDIGQLIGKLETQPSWSDFPIVLLMSPLSATTGIDARMTFKRLGNVILLERPFKAETLLRAAASVLRARRRQYQARSDLQERMDLNATLESRIAERTAALAQANDRLMREMNERERAQMALVQTQKMEALGHLTSGISHDFNNLLSIIQGNADLLDLLTTDERLKRMANTIRKAAKQGAKMTGQLLAFSRAQPLDLKAFDLNKALEGVKELLSASLGSKVQVQLDLAPGVSFVRADLNQIELAILNLAINAKDAIRGPGTVTVRTAVGPAPSDLPAGHDYAVISVIDTGHGINSEILAKVFDPFFTTKPLGKGTGLGLSQVYGIAQQSGGTAKIKSQVGQGTTVEIWLPLAEAQEMAEPMPRGDAAPQSDGTRACIVVVEDDSRVRQFIVESLEILGYQVMQAEHGQAGLEQLEATQPDLLITDFLMPGMTGAELIKKAHQKYPGLPAIIATGYADLQAIDEVIDTDMVLRKPFQLNELAYKVKSALAKGRRAAEAAVSG
ncbi:MAG: hybrid sensor histidine kinase/response regulator [Polaromonas sp.]|nr:hybrid sensor histidine kinase/response regulator [Polaromonas sp.]MDB5844598.1 hybrid sensor histidine kinase/response regulator [Polaromonas sp.]